MLNGQYCNIFSDLFKSAGIGNNTSYNLLREKYYKYTCIQYVDCSIFFWKISSMTMCFWRFIGCLDVQSKRCLWESVRLLRYFSVWVLHWENCIFERGAGQGGIPDRWSLRVTLSDLFKSTNPCIASFCNACWYLPNGVNERLLFSDETRRIVVIHSLFNNWHTYKHINCDEFINCKNKFNSKRLFKRPIL